jgi:hypothetical protein
MLEEPVPASEISLRLSKMVSLVLKNYRVIPMCPDRDYISLVRYFRPHLYFIDSFLIFVFIWLAICSQGMGIIQYILPPVPEDKELRDKNQAKNEEQKRLKDEKKAKKAKKAKKVEASAKRHREAEKAGLPEPESSEASISEIEGGGRLTMAERAPRRGGGGGGRGPPNRWGDRGP